MTALLGAVAPLAVILEGGYNLEATAAGVEATMRVLLGERPPKLPPDTPPVSHIAMIVIHEVIAVQVRRPSGTRAVEMCCCVACFFRMPVQGRSQQPGC